MEKALMTALKVINCRGWVKPARMTARPKAIWIQRTR